MNVPDGVHAFPQAIGEGDEARTFYPAAVETEKGILLIDVGFREQIERIGDHLDEVGADWTDVAGIVITHQDGDHASALAEVVERTGAPVYAHEECAPYVDGREHPIKGSDDERYPPATVDVELVAGVTFATEAGPMEVEFTPGHTPGHVSLYFPEDGFLLAADALTAEGGELHGPSEEFTLDMDRAYDSAMRLADRDVEHVLCYHGGYVPAGADRIREVVSERR